MSKKTYERRKKQGLCVICGGEKTEQKFVCCEKCRTKKRNYKRETTAYFKKLGFCPRCHKNKLFGDEKECLECVEKMYELNKRYKKNSKTNSSEYYKKHISILKEKGLCRSCGKNKVKEGCTYCVYCLIKRRKNYKENKIKKGISDISRSERPNYGLCYCCGKELDRDGRNCKKCTERAIKNFKK